MVKQRINRIPVGMLAGLLVAVVAAGGGAAWWTLNSVKPPNPSTTSPNTKAVPPSPKPTAAEQTAKIYWLRDTGKNLELVPKPITVAAAEPQAVLEAAFDGLLAGPKDTSVNSTIPEGTKLRSVKIHNDGIHVNLSPEFTTGGGSDAMMGRVAQVLYTATSLQPNAKVWIDVEGKPLELLGGEGLVLDQPMTRQSFKENFSF